MKSKNQKANGGDAQLPKEEQFHRKELLYGLKDWNERRTQGISGTIVKFHDEYKIEIEIPQLPGTSVYYDLRADFEMNEMLLNRPVIGDIASGDFIIRVLCLDDVEVGD